MFLTNTLSRAPLPSTAPLKHCLKPQHKEVGCLNLDSVNTAEFVRISNNGLKNMQCLTEANDQLQQLRMTVLQGWPETKQEIEPLIESIGRTVTKLECTMGCCTKVIKLLFQLDYVNK